MLQSKYIQFWKEIIISIGTSFIIWPPVFFISLLLIVTRSVVAQILKICYLEHYELTNGADGVFGFYKPGNGGSIITSYGVFNGVPDIRLIKHKFGALISPFSESKPLAKFSKIFTRQFGFYCWEKTGAEFNIDNHVRIYQNAPHRVYTESKLLEIVEDLSAVPMAEDKPQWEILIFPNYKDSDSSVNVHKWAMILRIHHAYGDAVSFLLMANDNLFDWPLRTAIDPTKPFKIPALAYVKCAIMGPYYFIRMAISFLLDKTNFRVENYSARKIYARSAATADIEQIKEIKMASKASVTAILISAIYTALRRTHEKLFEGQPIPEILNTANVSAMLPYPADSRLRNQFTVFGFPAPFNEKDAKVKLAKTHQVGLRVTNEGSPIFNYYVTKYVGVLPAVLQNLIMSMTGTPIMLSNIPGIVSPVKVFGTTLLDMGAWLPLINITGIGIVAFSYCGQLRFWAVADPKAIGERKELLQEFVDDIVKEIQHLGELYLEHETQAEDIKIDRNNNNCISKKSSAVA